jgi:hypothetical protein
VLVVGPDFAGNSTSPGAADASVVEWDSVANCGPQSLAVRTFVYDGDGLDNDNGGGNSTGDNLRASNEASSFVVP